MCVAFWIWNDHPVYSLLLALNRDEYFSRPSYPVHWWQDCEKILGGRDGKEGGTWMGITKNGRLAFLTNFREPEQSDKAVSRGELTTRFLQGSQSPLEYLHEIASEAQKYNGFNLVVADLRLQKMAYLSNRPKGADIVVKELAPGMYGLSNGLLDSPWPKVQLGKKVLRALTSEFAENEIPECYLLEEILKDKNRADYESLPCTGCKLDLEHKLSSIFVDCDSVQGQYGTRSMNVIAVRKNGQVSFVENFIKDGIWKDHQFEFQIETQ